MAARHVVARSAVRAGFEIAMLANQLIGDYVPLILLNSLPDDYGENPYKAGQRSGLARLDALLADLTAPSPAAHAPPARTLPACSTDEIHVASHFVVPGLPPPDNHGQRH